MSSSAGQYRVYKRGVSAAQFSLIPPRIIKTASGYKKIEQDGAVLIEVAKAIKGKDTFEWPGKISFALGMNDLVQIFSDAHGTIKLFHESPNGNSKKMTLQPGEGKFAGTFRMTLQEFSKDKSINNTIMVPLSAGEHEVMLRLLIAVMPKIIGWD